MIFGVVGGVSFYEGIVHMRDPESMRDPFWNYVVLGAAAVFEGASLLIALRQFNSTRGSRPFWRALHASKVPSTYTVIAEDSAALIGLGIAAVGIWASHARDMPELDGLASILIGVLLAAVAIVLMRESRGLVIGEGIRRETAQQIRDLVRAMPSVRDASMPLSILRATLKARAVSPPNTAALRPYSLSFAQAMASSTPFTRTTHFAWPKVSS